MSEVRLFNVSGSDARFGTTENGTPFAVASNYAKATGCRRAASATRLLTEDEKGAQTPSPHRRRPRRP